MERSPREIIDKYYPADSEVRGILITHSRMVASEALAIAARKGLDLDEVDILDVMDDETAEIYGYDTY